LIALEIPIIIVKIVANISLFITIYATWIFGTTPRFAVYLFWPFNIAGFFFISIGFRDQIIYAAKNGGFILFVSYVLLASYMIDQIPTRGKKIKENNDKK
tara:strand:- start:1451 stop:1750 length:300 start_codon:yes stop_codon:yes gene_type:complete